MRCRKSLTHGFLMRQQSCDSGGLLTEREKKLRKRIGQVTGGREWDGEGIIRKNQQVRKFSTLPSHNLSVTHLSAPRSAKHTCFTCVTKCPPAVLTKDANRELLGNNNRKKAGKGLTLTTCIPIPKPPTEAVTFLGFTTPCWLLLSPPASPWRWKP